MLNPRGWDDMDGADRLHLLFGEGNMMETALALKIGTTKLVLDLIEEGAAPDLPLADATETLRQVSRDETWKWLVRRADGKAMRAVDLQRAYLAAAQRRFAGRDPDTDWTLRTWEEVLDGLERDPMELADRLDWVAKLKLLYEYMDDTGANWGDDVLVSLDLVYHDVNPETGLYYGLEQAGLARRIVDDEAIRRAMRCPPTTTRAYARGRLVEHALATGDRAAFGWEYAYVDGARIMLRDPGDPNPPSVRRWLEGKR
jgi:proteasome accessory factor A